MAMGTATLIIMGAPTTMAERGHGAMGKKTSMAAATVRGAFTGGAFTGEDSAEEDLVEEVSMGVAVEDAERDATEFLKRTS